MNIRWSNTTLSNYSFKDTVSFTGKPDYNLIGWNRAKMRVQIEVKIGVKSRWESTKNNFLSISQTQICAQRCQPMNYM